MADRPEGAFEDDRPRREVVKEMRETIAASLREVDRDELIDGEEAMSRLRSRIGRNRKDENHDD